MNCRTCNNTLTGNFCSNCGRPVKIDRVDWHYIVHEIQHVLHLEKGIAHTVKELLVNPGPSINEFIRVDRSRLVKPVLFLVLTSLVYTTLEHLFHVEQKYIDYVGGTTDLMRGTLFNWLQNHYGYANLIQGLFIAFWLKLFYRDHNYNFFEILILLCFVMSMGMLIFSIFSLFEGFTGLHVMSIAGAVGVTYCSWAIGHFFGGRRVSSYFKAFASYMLGMLTFTITAFVLSALLDLITA